MTPSRRDFLRWSTGGAAWLLAGRMGGAGAEEAAGGATAGAESLPDPLAEALAVHRATRNTRLGALGTRLRAAREALRPWKPYRGLPREPLPTPQWDRGRALFALVRGHAPGAFAEGPLSRAELSRLLFLTNGVTGHERDIALRTAPSAGALYAGEVYLVAGRVQDLPPGLYYYAVGGHRLVRLREGDYLGEVAEVLERPADAAGAAAAVLLTNVFARYRVRYANRGYRYALVDSGHIGENLRLAAAELGLAERAPLRWLDDRLNALLQVDGRKEAVCALHLVGRRAAPEADAPAASPSPCPLVERGGAGSGELADPEAYHQATKLVRAVSSRPLQADGSCPAPAGGPPSGATSAAGGAAGAAGGTASTAGAAADPAADDGAPDTAVHDAIRVRRSTRRFLPDALPRAALLRILELAHGHPALARTDALDLYAVVHRVEELPAGLYRYDPATRRLEPRREDALADALVDAALGQRRTGEAAAALIGVARLAEATARGGARAYRDLLLEAGATAQRIYLAAEAQGLTARNLAAYYDDELDDLLGLDGTREVAVHLTAVGAGD